MMWWNETGGMGAQWLAMGIMMLLFWGATMSLLVWLIRRGQPSVSGAAHDRTPADELLAQRYARGEIDEAQFTRSRTVLRTPSGRV